MTRSAADRFFAFTISALAACATALSFTALAHEMEETIADPGFRPHSDNAAVFIDTLGDVSIAVYPTIIRRAGRTAHSFASQEQIVAFINRTGVAEAVARPLRIDLGRLAGRSQWDLFQNDMEQIAEKLTGRRDDAAYHVFLSFILPVDEQTIFGIHCYVLDKQGQNAFSFLLNSHHRLFIDADLVAANSSEEARTALMDKATRIGLVAFKAQIDQAR